MKIRYNKYINKAFEINRDTINNKQLKNVRINNYMNDDALTLHPFSLDKSKNFIILSVELIFINSIAPALALLTVGDNGAEFLAHTTTPSHPKK